MKNMNWKAASAVGARALLAFSIMATVGSTPAVSQDMSGYTDGMREQYGEALTGKKVALVPVAMSFDIAQAYAAGLQTQADKMGYELVIRDPNWSVEQAVQAVQQLIAEKPDVIVAHPLDAQAMNRLVKKAEDAGIYWIWANIKGGPNGDVFVGADHYTVDSTKVALAAEYCAAQGKSKIAVIGGPSGNQAMIAGDAAIDDTIQNYPELEIVSRQSAEGDANKAKAIADTVLKQHPDLCAFIGQWDGEDIGIPPAVADAGLTDKVAVFTSGGGSKETACDKIEDGSYTAYISHDIGSQVVAMNTAIAQLLQQKPTPGEKPYAAYVNMRVITADNVAETDCWTVPEVGQKAY